MQTFLKFAFLKYQLLIFASENLSLDLNQRTTVTRKNVAGIDVVSVEVLLF